MKKTILFLILSAVVAWSAGCTGQQNEEKDKTSSAAESITSSADEESKSIKTKTSSVRSPLDLEQWGKAAKFSTSEQQYYDVPVRVMSVLRGSRASALVKEWAENESWFTFSPPEKGNEWIAVEYEISLDSFPVDSEGTDASVSVFLSGTDGGYLTAEGKEYTAAAVNLTDGQYDYEGIKKGVIAWQSPEKCDDILLTIGEYEETQAFFKISMQKH